VIRLASSLDKDMILKWRNSPEIIKDSTLQREVTLEEHNTWFETTVHGIERLLWIVEPNAGTVRVDNHNWYGVVSIYLLPAFQGKGLGGRSIDEASSQAFAHWPQMTQLWAYIRHENLASTFAFGSVGYRESDVIGCPPGHIVMVRQRPNID